MPLVAGTHAPGRGWGVERMVKTYHHVPQQLVVVGVRVKDNAKWWKNRRYIHMLRECEKWTKHT